MPKFSIVIPVYNVEEYLNDCVNSVINQTYKDFEIILVDDGSTDNSGSLCDEFALKDKRVSVVHQLNKGLSVARNEGLSNASGEYIIFLDSDDYWKYDCFLKNIAERLKKTNPDVLTFNYVKFAENISFKPYFSIDTMPEGVDDSYLYMMQNELWIACAWNKVIKRSLLVNNDLKFIEGITSEDIDWSLRLAMYSQVFDYINIIGVCYRQREVSISQSDTPEKVGALFSNIKKCVSIIDNSKNVKAILLKPFIGYQYGTALLHLALLEKSKAKTELLKTAKSLRYLLKWSNNQKVRILRLISRFGGLKTVLLVLKIKK